MVFSPVKIHRTLVFSQQAEFRFPYLLGLLLKVSVSGTMRDPPVAPVIVRLSRLESESLYEVVYEPMRALLGVAATKTEKYFSCSILDVVSPLEVPENVQKIDNSR